MVFSVSILNLRATFLPSLYFFESVDRILYVLGVIWLSDFATRFAFPTCLRLHVHAECVGATFSLRVGGEVSALGSEDDWGAGEDGGVESGEVREDKSEVQGSASGKIRGGGD